MDGIFCVYAPPQQQLVKFAGLAQSVELLTTEREVATTHFDSKEDS